VVGDQFAVQKIGLTVFNNEYTEVPIDAWGLDDLVVARVRAVMAPGTGVRRIAYPRAAFAPYDHAAPSLFRNRADDLTAIVRQITANAGCKRYVAVTRLSGQLDGTNQTLRGIASTTLRDGTRALLTANLDKTLLCLSRTSEAVELLRKPSTDARGTYVMMQLYWSPRSRSFSALWLMEETGQPYERVLTDITTGAQKTPEYLAINPMAKVPALRDGEATLAEAAAICAYVAERYPEAKLAPPLGDPLRAKYLYWLFFSPGCIEPAMVQVATKIEMNSTAAGWGDAQRVFDVLDKTLEKGPWILGDTFSAADIIIGSGLNFAVRLFKMVPSRPSFDAYIARCAARPAFQRAEKLAAG
jgi:glutathione S-transferase